MDLFLVLYTMELFLKFKFQIAIECGIMELCMEWCGIMWNWYRIWQHWLELLRIESKLKELNWNVT